MKVLILTGVREELESILAVHPFEYMRGHRLYRSEQFPDVFARSTGPGLQKRKEVEEVLELIFPDLVISAGLVGALRDDEPIKSGCRLHVGQVIQASNHVIYPGWKGKHSLLTVDEPIFDPVLKMDLALEYRADACDMEGAKVVELVGQVQNLAEHALVMFVKIVSDTSDLGYAFEHEPLIRDWHTKSFSDKIQIWRRFPGSYFDIRRVLQAKRRALAALGQEVLKELLELNVRGGFKHGRSNLFIPN